MKRQTLVFGVLSMTAVAMLTGCVDDKYDLTDIDTTSRFTVDDLTVPINLSEIKLENVIDLDDNNLIEKVMIDGKECYSIVQKGEIAPTEFSIGGVHVDQPTFDPSLFQVNNVPGGGTFVPIDFDVEPIDLPKVDLQPYEFNMDNIDKALEELKDIKTKEEITIQVVLNILTQELTGGNASISFQDLKIQLPWGLITEDAGYDKATGMLTVNEIPVENGKATLLIKASGLELGDKGKVKEGKLGIEGEVGIKSGKIKMTVSNLTIPTNIDIRAEYSVSSFDLASFSGKINYNMDAIKIDPITLNDLPDFLDSPETNLIIAKPQILISIKNPVGKWLEGKGQIILTSNFKKGEPVPHHSEVFTISGDNANLAFCSEKEGYTFVRFDELRDVLTNGDSGLPTSIEVNIKDINFSGEVTDFPLGDLGSAEGSYEFNAPLAFGVGSRVVYETTVDGWSSDTLDDVNITMVKVNAKCTTNLPVGVQLSIFPIDKNGREIAVTEESGMFMVPAMAKNEEVLLVIESKGGPIKNLDGVKFHADVDQMSEANEKEALGPDLQIKLDDIRVTVDGYYETDF